VTDPRHGRAYRDLRDRLGRIWRNQNRPCWMCKQPIDWDADHRSGNAYELDHVLPVSTHPDVALDPGNALPSHRSCNRNRGNRAPGLGLGIPSRDW
jgi:CRISPR/Cas system Type II protein with McrA/HNH and RuvC-like nuclease domain